MALYFVRRLALSLPVLLGVATLVFSLIHLGPGDPAQPMAGEGASAVDVAALRDRASSDGSTRRQPGVQRPQRGMGWLEGQGPPVGGTSRVQVAVPPLGVGQAGKHRHIVR
jgi:ABC-type microcin C transport system permease subunit YejB